MVDDYNFTYDSESAAEAQARIHDETGEVEEVGQKTYINREGWKKANAEKKTKVRYKTIDEVISEGDVERFGPGFGSQGGVLGKVGSRAGLKKYSG